MKFEREQLVRTAVRENNTKRPYLLVNPSQGKHVPVAPETALAVFSALAEQVQERVGTTAPVLVIAFAETATAIGAAVAAKLQNPVVLMQTTREVMALSPSSGRNRAPENWSTNGQPMVNPGEGSEGKERIGQISLDEERESGAFAPKTDTGKYLCFSETHSHATEQYITRHGLEQALKWAEHVVFVEDEVTTGNTILHLMDVLGAEYDVGEVTFGVASILNGMTEESRERYHTRGIWTRYLLHTDNAAMESTLGQYRCDGKKYPAETACTRVPEIIQVWGMPNIRSRAWSAEPYQEACETLAQAVCDTVPADAQNVLVLGTEECMYPGLWAGRMLEKQGHTVRFHATTRSPIQPSTEPGYPLLSRYTLQSLYDRKRVTYIYNLKAYDHVCIVTDAPEPEKNGLASLIAALEQAGNTKLTVFHWKSKYWRSI